MVAQGYIGRNPGDSSVVISRQSFTASGITTDFTFASGYTVGYFDLYINGVRLIEGTDYTASDSATFTVLNGGAQDGDVLEGVAYKAFNLGDTYTSKVGIQSAGIAIGNAETLNFVGTGNTFAVNGTTIDVSISGGGSGITTANINADTLNVSGLSTFQDDVTFTGNANNAVWNKSNDSLEFSDGAKAAFGTGLDLSIYHSSGHTEIRNITGDLRIDSDTLKLRSQSYDNYFVGNADGAVELYHDNSKKLETTGIGITVFGNTETQTLNVSGVSTLGVTSVSQLNVSGVSTLGTVKISSGIVTATSGIVTYYGDGSNLTFAPKIISYDPAALSTGISTTTNITFTFDQNIQFAGTGTIEVRETSNSGTIATSFAISGGTAPTGLSIANNQLIINPTEPLNYNTVHYVVLPSAGIANAQGSYYAGSNGYNFRTLTEAESFSMQGGDHVFDVNTGTGPTGWHRYHVFSSTGIITSTGPSIVAQDLSFVLVGGGGGANHGGGGAGGVISGNGPELNLNAGTYTITLGAGGAGAGISPGFLTGSSGQDSTISTPTNTILKTAHGGGGGGAYYPDNGSGTGLDGGSGGGGSPASTQTYWGDGVPGQGYPGGGGGTPVSWSQPGGGGGGSGAAGGNGSVTLPGTPSTANGGNGGTGGIGAPHPAFTSTILSGNIPTIPASTIIEIGTSGRFGGGGGGGAPAYDPGSVPVPQPEGGAGGGGNGSHKWNNPAEDGFTNTGGGGGGGSYDPVNNYVGGAGGSGVFMIRYGIPNPS